MSTALTMSMDGPIYSTGKTTTTTTCVWYPICDPSTEETQDGIQGQLHGEFQASLEDIVKLKMNRKKTEIKGGRRDDLKEAEIDI